MRATGTSNRHAARWRQAWLEISAPVGGNKGRTVSGPVSARVERDTDGHGVHAMGTGFMPSPPVR